MATKQIARPRWSRVSFTEETRSRAVPFRLDPLHYLPWNLSVDWVGLRTSSSSPNYWEFMLDNLDCNGDPSMHVPSLYWLTTCTRTMLRFLLQLHISSIDVSAERREIAEIFNNGEFKWQVSAYFFHWISSISRALQICPSQIILELNLENKMHIIWGGLQPCIQYLVMS